MKSCICNHSDVAFLWHHPLAALDDRTAAIFRNSNVLPTTAIDLTVDTNLIHQHEIGNEKERGISTQQPSVTLSAQNEQ